jgi:hypothetical protein
LQRLSTIEAPQAQSFCGARESLLQRFLVLLRIFSFVADEPMSNVVFLLESICGFMMER